MLARTVHAVDAQAAYDSIADKNAFRLKPLITAPTTPEPPVEPPSEITLTGITTIFGDKLALLEVQPPGQPKAFLTLSEGQREGDVEIISIDERAETVTINYRGTRQPPLTFDKVKKKAGIGVASSQPPFGGGPPGLVRPVLPSANTANNSVNITPRMRSIPTRNIRSAVTTSGDGMEGSGIGGVIQTSGNGSSPATPSMTPEEQVIRMEINRELTKDKVAAGLLPPLPPTPFTPAGEQ